MAIQSYRDLRVWQESISLAEMSYALTRSFPRDELFGMTSQVRRSSVAVAANIAEGYGRESSGSYVQFLRIAQGSLKELETHLIIAERVGLATGDRISPLLVRSSDVGKMLRALIRSIEATS